MTTLADRTKAADRQRRYRRRQHPTRHEIVAPVPTSDPVLGMLVRTGWLRAEEWQDRHQVGLAISRMLKDAAEKTRDA